MKFLNEFNKRKIKVWEDFYINYELMLTILEPLRNQYKENKKLVYLKQKKNEGFSENLDNQPLLDQFTFDNKINLPKIQYILNEQMTLEIKKVDHFYTENINNNIRPRLNSIYEQINYSKNIKEFKIYSDNFEMALKELYKEVNLLSDFFETNELAKNKLISKYEKYIKNFEIENSENDVVTFITNFYKNNTELHLARQTFLDINEEIQKIFMNNFSDKYKGNTYSILKDYIKINKMTESQGFYLGFFIGLLFFLIFTIFVMAYHFDFDIDNDPDFKSIFPMFRGFFIVCLYWWILGLDVHFWNKAHISYKVIFKFDNHFSTSLEIYKRASIFTFILLIAILFYLIKRANINFLFGILNPAPAHIFPLICWICFFIYMFCPFKIFNYQGRKFLFDLTGESIASFLMKTDFRHVWFIDQLTTFIAPIRDMEYTLCYYAYYNAPQNIIDQYCNKTRGVYLFIAYFPNIIRILQCCKQIFDSGKSYPQNWNIGKYTMNIIVASLSFFWPSYPSLHIVWLLATFISSCYSFYWDIKFDFGLLKKGKGYPLREKLMYKNKLFYYFASFFDFFLRFLWLLTLSPEVINSLFRPETLSITLNSLEIIRRGVWNIIRLENKHLEISKEFKVTNEIDLPYIKVNGKFVNNETNLLNIMSLNREDKIKYEIDKILFNNNNKMTYSNNNNNKKGKMVEELNEYLQTYINSTEENMADENKKETMKLKLSRKL